MTGPMPPKRFVQLTKSGMRLSISALRRRGRDLPGGLHFALEQAADDGHDRLASFVVQRGAPLDRFFAAIEQAEADAVECGWWPADDQPTGEAA